MPSWKWALFLWHICTNQCHKHWNSNVHYTATWFNAVMTEQVFETIYWIVMEKERIVQCSALPVLRIAATVPQQRGYSPTEKRQVALLQSYNCSNNGIRTRFGIIWVESRALVTSLAIQTIKLLPPLPGLFLFLVSHPLVALRLFVCGVYISGMWWQEL